ncbi:hypothetical protein BJY04DRAFT_211107 [Aspergillus karnatakaensis]|uniref:uncharacterized protein n=1 Tax=Aspergillus karnatakaensis TaxID=1810916 RepID=UPI003CCE2F9D
MKFLLPVTLGIASFASASKAGLAPSTIPGGKPFIFNAFVVFNYPNWKTQQPRDARLEGANFYCYATDQGYLSFGWWLNAAPETDYTHCRPDSTDYIYYEYADKMHECNEQGCSAHVLNYWAGNNSLRFETDYVFSDANIGLPEVGDLSIFYRDEHRGPWGTGTRHVLSSTGSIAEDCCKALTTLRGVRDRFKLDLNFELNDICPRQEAAQNSWWHWWGRGSLTERECDDEGGLDSDL